MVVNTFAAWGPTEGAFRGNGYGPYAEGWPSRVPLGVDEITRNVLEGRCVVGLCSRSVRRQ